MKVKKYLTGHSHLTSGQSQVRNSKTPLLSTTSMSGISYITLIIIYATSILITYIILIIFLIYQPGRHLQGSDEEDENLSESCCWRWNG